MAARPLSIGVIGAGWAGLAAAVEATRRGHAVTVFEMAPQVGGRARSIDFDGDSFDNGQHILIGAYVECLRLMRQVGVDVDRVLHRMPLCVVGPDGIGLRLGAGPAMLAFAASVARHPTWTWHQRIGLLIEAGRWSLNRFRCAPRQTVAQLASRLSGPVRDELIDPLCVAALNTPSGAASASVFLRVLRDALFTAPGSADLLLPRAPLDDLFPRPAAEWLRERDVPIHAPRRVLAVDRTASGWAVDGSAFDAVVLAASAFEAARLMADVDPTWSADAAAFGYEPIVTVHAQSDGAQLPEPMVMLPSNEVDLPAQFVFDQGRLGGPAGRLTFVVSGAAAWVERGIAATTEATLEQARRQLSRHLKSPLHAVRTLTEKRATFRCTPDIVRPRAEVAPRLVAAGDYVAGPYPATLEGAVRAGVAAVDLIGRAA